MSDTNQNSSEKKSISSKHNSEQKQNSISQNSQNENETENQDSKEFKIDEQEIEGQFTGEDAFLTDFKNSNLVKDMDPQVVELADQLNNLVNQLESKIDHVIEKHEGEFLIAYKNHMQKIRRELLEMKRKTDEQERNFQAKDRISALEKQLAWFREEASKLYNKLEQKNKETDQLKMRIQDLEKEKIFLEGQVKSLMKKNKYMNVKLNTQKFENQQFDNNYNSQNLHNQSVSYQYNQQTKNKSQNPKQIFDHLNINSVKIKSQTQIKTDFVDQQQQQNFESSQNQQQEQFNQIQQQVDSIKSLVHFSQSDYQAQQIVEIFVQNIQQNGLLEGQSCAREVIYCFKKLNEEKNKTIKQYKDKSEQILKEKIKLNNTRSDLEAFFLECVEAVRRQVLKRKQPQDNLNQFLNSVKDYNVFRLEDKQKILELMVQHEKILLYIYQKIFPTQFSLHIKNVLEQEKNQAQLIQNQENQSDISNYQQQNNQESHQKQGTTYLESLYQKPGSRGLNSQNKKSRIARNTNMSFDHGFQQHQQQQNISSNQQSQQNSQFNQILQKNNIALPNTTQSKYRSNTQYNNFNNNNQININNNNNNQINNNKNQFQGYSKIINQSKSIQNSVQNNNNSNNNSIKNNISVNINSNFEGLVNNRRKRGHSGKIRVESGKLVLK